MPRGGRKLTIGDSLALPLDWLTLATVVYGARGSGKTTFGSVIAEEAFAAGQRFCAIDIKGDWWGLKAAADGEGEGIPLDQKRLREWLEANVTDDIARDVLRRVAIRFVALGAYTCRYFMCDELAEYEVDCHLGHGFIFQTHFCAKHLRRWRQEINADVRRALREGGQ